MIELRWLLKGEPGEDIQKGIRYYVGNSPRPSKVAILQFRDNSTGRFYDQEDGWEDVPIVLEEDLNKFKTMENKDG